MNFLRSVLQWGMSMPVPLLLSLAVSGSQTPASSAQAPSGTGQSTASVRKSYRPALLQNGDSFFQQNGSFCHGREAGGGEAGPEPRRCELGAEDGAGDK